MTDVRNNETRAECIDIIVPVYNQEKLIKRCIESVLNQTSGNWNLILIDDGSTDGTGDICRFYQNMDRRILYHYKNNGGVSSARNMGLKYTKGDRCIFLDADDYIESNYIDNLSEVATDYDLVLTGNYHVDDMGKVKTCNEPEAIDIIGLEEMILYIFNQKNFGYFTSPWGKLFKHSIIEKNRILFRDINYGEDMCFVFDYLACSSKIKLLNGTHYFYLETGYSLSRRPILDIWIKLKEINEYSRKFFYMKYDNIWNYMFFRIIKVALLNDMEDYRKWKYLLYEIKQEADFKRLSIFKVGDFKDKVIYSLLKYVHPKIIYLILKSYDRLS